MAFPSCGRPCSLRLHLDFPRRMNDDRNTSNDLQANVRRARFARAEHRARQHADAHADDAGDHGPVAEHPLVPRGDAQLVTTPDAMGEMLDHLRTVGSFAYDSEFIGELTYVPKLCLVQVATTARVALIDPLAGLDLLPFWELVADGAV